jgi:hypothetical protein
MKPDSRRANDKEPENPRIFMKAAKSTPSGKHLQHSGEHCTYVPNIVFVQNNEKIMNIRICKAEKTGSPSAPLRTDEGT